jgi:hypothetical protein
MNRRLTVNADDFGLSEGVNRGIVRGIVTSTSLMVRGTAGPQASALARELPELSVGLHLDLAECALEAGERRAAYERGAPAPAGDYSAERLVELEALCAPAGRSRLEGGRDRALLVRARHRDSRRHALGARRGARRRWPGARATMRRT